MSGIRQYQRRAIESFVEEPEALPPPSNLIEPKIRTFDSTALFLHGVSIGIGSCSDIHGMDVLVVGEFEPNREEKIAIAARLATSRCAYTVEFLPRTRTTLEECQATSFSPGTYTDPRDGFIGLSGVELLEFLDPESNGEVVIFERTGKRKLYVAIPS